MPEVVLSPKNSSRMRRHAATVAVSLAALSVLLGGGGAAAAELDDVTDYQTSINAICGDIATFGEDDPEGALKLITDLRAPAQEVLANGGTLGAKGEVLAAACEDQRLALIEATATKEDDPAPSGPALWKKNFDDFVKAWITPFSGQALAVGGIWALLLVLARFFVFVPRLPFQSSPTFGVISATLGILAIALSGPLVVSKIGELLRLPENIFVAVGAALPEVWGELLLGIAGAILLSSAMARRLRLSLSVTDDEGKPSVPLTSDLLARLYKVGGSAPKGLEVPSGTDVSALSDVVATLSAKPFLAAAQTVIKAVFAVTPWKITVDSADKSRLVIEVYRNSRHVLTDTLDPSDLKLAADTAADSALTMAAATIVVTLARSHTGFDGLAEATDAGSVALQYIATKPGKPEADAITLLAQAVERDPKNRAAAFALDILKHRSDTKSEDIEAFVVRLMAACRDLRRPRFLPVFRHDYSLLRMRVMRAYLALLRNLLAAKQYEEKSNSKPRPTSDQLKLASEAAKLLRGTSSMAPRLTLEMQPIIATDLRVLGAAATETNGKGMPVPLPSEFRDAISETKDWYSEAQKSKAPEIAYSVACFDVQGPKPTSLDPETVTRFSDAFVDQELSDWARQDPELVGVRALRAFTDLFAPIKTDFWALAEFADLKDRLRAAGYADPAQLAGKQEDDALRRYLLLSQPVFAHVIEVAELVKTASAVTVAGAEFYTVKLLQALLDEGVRTKADVHADWKNADSERVKKFAEDQRKLRLDAPEPAVVAAWMTAFAK